MAPTLQVRQTLDKTAAMREAIRALDASRVLAGIPGEQAMRKPEPGESAAPIGNAAIGYIQEHGSPANNIPARPFVRPGIKAVLPEVREELRKAAGEALRGNIGGVTKSLHKIGGWAVNSIQGQFFNNDWAPLADATIAARTRAENRDKVEANKGRPRDKRLKIPQTRKINPLIFTRQLQRAITYVIRGRGE